MKFSPPYFGPSDSRPVIFGKSPLSASPMKGGTNSCTVRIAAQIASNAGSCHEVKIRRAALITLRVRTVEQIILGEPNGEDCKKHTNKLKHVPHVWNML